MEAEHFLNLFDSCWFNLEILNQKQIQKLPFSFDSKTNSSSSLNSQPKFSSLRSILMRSKSDELSSMASFNYDSHSPNSVLFTPHLKTIPSGKESRLSVEEEQKEQKQVQQQQFIQEKEQVTKMNTKAGKNSRERNISRRKIAGSKSLSELEFEELKGFMDLGFVFSEEDKDSSLVAIIPGLQRLGNNKQESEQEQEQENLSLQESEFSCNNGSIIARPYLSEAWEVLDMKRKRRENINSPMKNWRVPVPALTNEIDMKDSLKLWAHTVASAVR